MKSPTPAQIKSFQKKILIFYKEEGRHDLPWRHTTDRYKIMVSEIMLQQTQVSRVIEKYNNWIEEFPTPQSLAKATLAQVLKAWSGLGYNARGKRLWDAAKIIVDRHKGTVPKNSETLLSLPGIGPYTARSILIFADNAPLATVDTNIRRILIHEFNLPETTSNKDLFELAEQLLPEGKSRDYHNALMDYGSIKLTSKKSGIKPKTTQSKFAGSRRFYRGQIIKYLTTNKTITLKQAKKLFPNCKHDLQSIFDELIAEKILEVNTRSFFIKN
ncbi:Fe-S cluster assembly protein HesB [Candidatus Woesearchaeota archaeon]|nr:Fe-S cluster assembly protein HesB [Candidatus Woesearchaeota archaeon]